MPWQAVFHLQTRVPAILPPICALLDLPEDTVLERPLHGGREAPQGLLEVRQLEGFVVLGLKEGLAGGLGVRAPAAGRARGAAWAAGGATALGLHEVCLLNLSSGYVYGAIADIKIVLLWWAGPPVDKESPFASDPIRS